MTQGRILTHLVRLCLSLALAPCAFPQQAGQNPQALKKFKEALERDGFIVTVGGVRTFNLAAQYCAGSIADAGYYNVPSVVPVVPKAPDPTSELVVDFKLRPDEAIVVIGLNPPPVKYFGYYAFVSSKVFPEGMYKKCGDPQGCRQKMVATIGDAINNGIIHTIGPTPFNSPVAVIYTPDQGTDSRVRSALRTVGYPAAIINTFVLPASMLNLGHGEYADELRIPTRNGMWVDQNAGDAYTANAPLSVFRVTPSVPAIANPFPAPPLRVRGTGHTEMDLMNKLFELRHGIIAANPGLYTTDIISKPNWYEGFDYIQRGLDPGSDVRDGLLMSAGYLPEYGNKDAVTLADDEFLMIFGANHVVTGKATYMSITAYPGEEGKLAIGSVYHDHFPDTANAYLPPGDPAAKRMYAYKVSRNCRGEQNCMPLSLENCPKGLTIGPATKLGLIIRTYLEPATNVGAAMPELLYDRVIKFSPRPPSQQ
jgi:hypothetical protein